MDNSSFVHFFAMSDRDRIRDIITYHEKKAEDESKREVGDDPLYDGIAWRNTEPFLPKRGWILDAGGGAGVWSIRIAEKTNCDVVLFDVAPPPAERSPQKNSGSSRRPANRDS